MLCYVIQLGCSALLTKVKDFGLAVLAKVAYSSNSGKELISIDSLTGPEQQHKTNRYYSSLCS